MKKNKHPLEQQQWSEFTWKGRNFKRSRLYPGCKHPLQWKSESESDTMMWVHTYIDDDKTLQCKAFLGVRLVGWYDSDGIGNTPIEALENALEESKRAQAKTVTTYLAAQEALDRIQNGKENGLSY